MAKRNLLTFDDLSDNMKKALHILRDGKTRSTMAIQKEMLIHVTTLRKALNRLHLFELVDEIQHHHGNQWIIAHKGTELLSQNEQFFDKSEQIDVSQETKELLTESLNEVLVVAKQKKRSHLSRQEAEVRLPDQETVVCVPCEKALKPQEKLTLGFVAFWLEGKAQEFQEMARMMRTQIETNEHSGTVKQ